MDASPVKIVTFKEFIPSIKFFFRFIVGNVDYTSITLLFLVGDCCTIAFILPNEYRKHTQQRKIPKAWRIVLITDIGRACFTLDGGGYRVPTSFPLWKCQRRQRSGFDSPIGLCHTGY